MSRYLGDDKPPIEDVLAHHGVKGMHWGVRKERDSSSSGGSSSSRGSDYDAAKKAYMDVAPIKRSTSEASKAFSENQQKFLDKFNAARQTKKEESISKLKVKAADLDTQISSLKKENKDLANTKGISAALTKSANRQIITDYTKQRDAILKTVDAKERGKLTPTQKKLLIGAAVAGGLLAYSAYTQRSMSKLAGLPVTPEQFKSFTTMSKTKTWGFSGYIQESSFAREEFTINAGETFHRLSSTAENGIRPGSYVTCTTDDFNRYVTAFRHEVVGSELHHITFTATKPIRVPDLTTTLETLRETMEERGMPTTSAKVRSQYQFLSGGKWAEGYNLGKDGSGPTHITGDFMKKLMEKGYGAFVDEMDAGVIGDKPLVFLDAPSVTSHATKLMTKTDIKSAESQLKELTSRK